LAITFKIAAHLTERGQVVEIFDDGVLVGALYPMADESGVKLVSKHLDYEQMLFDALDPPAVHIRLVK